ncbi:MAG: alkaline phosphatase PhoX [Saprospiraceae bacterium]
MRKSKSTRRTFLKQSSAISLGFFGLQSFIMKGCDDPPSEVLQQLNMPYGQLFEDDKKMLKLPKGFTYKIISRQGEKMTDGLLTPGLPDGMATFDGGNGKVIVVRNHELISADFGPVGKTNEVNPDVPQEKIYDLGSSKVRCKGGTTTFVYDEATGAIESSWLSLTGTIRNCAGGSTNWNSWVSYEETFVGKNKNLKKRHGYNFEVPATLTPSLADPIPLTAMGRFNHEAICVDPNTGIVYQTEDRNDSCIYRFIPNEKGNLKAGGKLQALVIKSKKKKDTRNWEAAKMPTNKKLKVKWVDINDVNPAKDSIRYQAQEQGAAIFARGEGMWFGKDEIYFACTSGGAKKWGQVFRYVPSPMEGTVLEDEEPGTIELFLEPNDREMLQNCDNLTVAPWGDIIMCEDRATPNIVGVTPSGEMYRIAENIGRPSEFAGGVFSPSGKTFFVNIQHFGLTLAITGPWDRTKHS